MTNATLTFSIYLLGVLVLSVVLLPLTQIAPSFLVGIVAGSLATAATQL